MPIFYLYSDVCKGISTEVAVASATVVLLAVSVTATAGSS